MRLCDWVRVADDDWEPDWLCVRLGDNEDVNVCVVVSEAVWDDVCVWLFVIDKVGEFVIEGVCVEVGVRVGDAVAVLLCDDVPLGLCVKDALSDSDGVIVRLAEPVCDEVQDCEGDVVTLGVSDVEPD